MRCNDGSVVTDDPDDYDLAVRPELGDWLTGAKRTITELLAGAKRVMGVVALGPGATQAAADQMVVVARRAGSWLDRHPCPDPAIGAQFAEAFDGFTSFADECAWPPGTSRPIAPETSTTNLPGPPLSLMEAMYATRQNE